MPNNSETNIRENPEFKALVLELKKATKENFGSRAEIARRANCSQEWVRQVLNGKVYSMPVIKVAIAWLAEKKAEISQVTLEGRQVIQSISTPIN